MKHAVPGLVIRAVRRDDMVRLQAFHDSLSASTVRNRFFGAHPHLSDDEARRFSNPPSNNQRALVATVDDAIVGVGRYVRLGFGAPAAEVAFVVADGHQAQGIGRRLFVLLADIGWNEGIRRFVADTFVGNVAMLDVFRGTPHAATVMQTRRDGGVLHLVMSITSPSAVMTAQPC